VIRLLKSRERYRHGSLLGDFEVNKLEWAMYSVSFSSWAEGAYAMYSWLNIETSNCVLTRACLGVSQSNLFEGHSEHLKL